MIDDRDDRLDEQLREAARDYNPPPETPRAEIWQRIQAARAAERRPTASPAIPLFRRPVMRFAMGIAALLALGIAIGRVTAPRVPATVNGPATVAAAPDTDSAVTTAPDKRNKPAVAARYATNEHLSQVETFLTEFGTRPPQGSEGREFTGRAQDLLTTTRLLLDSKRVTDVRTHQLLQDLELVLVQIATFNPKDRREDLDLIADGLAQNHLRTRLRNAIPAGSAIRM
jgi:hypothetical protein